ncbi:bromodomain-containing protein 8 [Anastrepha obliqua]|uniref:bromodomain-containing protein 8 n=1 Tax=Anastrepha obliqua TaxID=95512 RepID=UPI002409ED6A|nr:bromodomain-containing protein 8 [Anastrepha obliqua]
MASTVQERQPLNRMPLDKWTTKEQLCLASAVSRSGDQNWMSVSRSLKLICGNGNTARPVDWFSQKNCAVQYGHLLENVETPKRKKRTSESASDSSSPATVETTTDLILRRLNDERIQELKTEIRKEQEEFAQICRELKALQSETLYEEQLHELWSSIEKQQEQKRVEEMKLENQMREREQERLEMQRNWRTLTQITTPVVSPTQAITTDTKAVDMDVEDIIRETSPQQEGITASNSMQQKQSTQPGTSPLLSSLLKCHSPVNTTPPISTNTSAGSSNNSARSSAPTITTLLTCGSIPNKNQPAITLKASIPPQKAAQLLSSPISGPPTITSVPVTTITAQNSLSPSQAAPTLSMLLERNKISATANGSNENHKDASKQALEETPNVSDSNKDEIPMELDEDIVSHVDDNNGNIISANESEEPDSNEEQQLLEVFKNIGNIDELDIDVAAVIDDEEVDFLKDMGADSLGETTNVADFEHKEDTNIISSTSNLVAEKSKENDGQDIAINTEGNGISSAGVVILNQVEETIKTVSGAEGKPKKIETISSDDSNDNIPLAAVASLEQRAAHEKVIFKEKNDSTLKNDDIEDSNESGKNKSDQTTKILLSSFEEDNQAHDKLEKQLADLVGANDLDETKNLDEDGKSPALSESSDVIVIPTDDDDSCGDKAGRRNEKSSVDVEAAKIKKDLESDVGATELAKNATGQNEYPTEMVNTLAGTNQEALVPLPPTISIADTDEDSSTTDISIVTRKDDKSGNTSLKHNAPLARKGLHDTIRQDQQNKTDDESTTQFSSSSSSSVTPARPPMLRKLRDRDRSESPMIEGESHMATNNINTTPLENLNSQRLRRRYSSTPINDSIPNSPASSDRDRDELETRVPKKSLLSIFHVLQYSKNASALQRAFHEDVKFDEVCLRPMDMLSIRKYIETGTIRNVSELQRDIMLMCQNGLMLFKNNTAGFNAANAFMQECQALPEFVANTCSSDSTIQIKDNKDVSKSQNVSGTSSKSRSGSRKSQRIS